MLRTIWLCATGVCSTCWYKSNIDLGNFIIYKKLSTFHWTKKKKKMYLIFNKNLLTFDALFTIVFDYQLCSFPHIWFPFLRSYSVGPATFESHLSGTCLQLQTRTRNLTCWFCLILYIYVNNPNSRCARVHVIYAAAAAAYICCLVLVHAQQNNAHVLCASAMHRTYVPSMLSGLCELPNCMAKALRSGHSLWQSTYVRNQYIPLTSSPKNTYGLYMLVNKSRIYTM